MSREDFRQRVLEEQIFNELKDKSIKNGKYIRLKYQGTNINYSRLYVRIVNYQIKEYGCRLENYVPRKSPKDLINDNRRARQRRYNRRNYERKN